MASVGAYLRQLRETRGVSLQHIAGVTRVSSTYLRALETDDFAALPEPVFTRGFVRAYCQVLGEPPDEALALYDSQRNEVVAATAVVPPAGPRRSATVVPRPPVDPRARNRGPVLVSLVLLIVLGIALFAVTLALQSGRDTPDERRAARPAPASPAVSVSPAQRPAEAPKAVPAPPPAQTPASAPSSAPAGAPPDTSAAPNPPRPGGNRLVARATETTWIRVRTEDGQRFDETIPAGQMREWVSTGPFTLTVGNAGGIKLELNGRAVPSLGPSGAVIPRLVLPAEKP
jgi:cytoskeleton protein RodZ